MVIDILTLFPTMFENVLGESMLKIAQKKGIAKISVRNLRDWTFDTHKTADDKPFGGGPGMVLKVGPIDLALKELTSRGKGPGARGPAGSKKEKIILVTPQGKRFDQKMARELAREKRLVFICGHYEGIDERIRSLADEEISIGDYILTCGELPAMVMVDSIVRLLPGVLGKSESLSFESFEKGLLEYPQYTRPSEYKGMKVPDILLSGDHKKIEAWRMEQAVQRTKDRRPDLIESQKAKGKTTGQKLKVFNFEF
jgi:tRNA (guanine37-N1)-methyltransferase